MGQYNGAVITTAGQAVLAQAIGGAELTITKVVTSATAIPPGTDLTALTAIADVEQTAQPTSVQVFNDNIVQISTRFSNAGVAAAYLIKTLGVFGRVTGGAETLLAVSTAVTPDQMPAEDAIAPSAFIYNIQLTVQSADQITVTVNDAGTATVADVQALDAAKLGKSGDGENVTVTFDDVNPDPAVIGLNAFTNSLVSGITLTSLLQKLKTVFNKYVPPKYHRAVNASTFGAGDATYFGHVKLSDVFSSADPNGAAENGMAASQNALNAAYTELSNVDLDQWDAIDRNYEGRDLTDVFADEITNYSDEWQWIQARLNAHNLNGLRVGDYIPIKVGAENHLAEIAGINPYYKTGDTAVGYHIDWITKDCYSQTVQWNTSNNNNGSADNSNPFLVSNLKSWLDNTLYPLLPSKLKSVIKGKRVLAPYRYTSGSTLTDDNSWGWETFDKLWVPFEHEIFDQTVWSTRGYGNGQAIQYPIFANSYAHRIKGVGPNGSRCTWWSASARSGRSTSVVTIGGGGYANDTIASSALRVPVCFRTMED